MKICNGANGHSLSLPQRDNISFIFSFKLVMNLCTRLLMIALIGGLLFASRASGQILDTIEYSMQQKPKFFVSLASFNTFVDKDFASFGGVRMGLKYNNRVRLGIGYFELTNNGVVSTIAIDEGQGSYQGNGQLELSFYSISAEYSIRNDFPWHLAVVPFQIGVGPAHYEYISRISHSRVKTPTELIILYQPEFNIQYSILRWFAVGLTTGYRFTLLRSRQQTRHFDSVNFSFDISISLDELYYELKGVKQ